MKQLLILSGKGGTGKTTVASAFIRLLNAEAAADCDVDAPNLHLVIGPAGPPEREDYYGLPKAEIDSQRCARCDMCRKLCRFEAISADGNTAYTVDPLSCEGCGVCAAFCPAGAIRLNPAVSGELSLYCGADRTFSTASLKTGGQNSGKLVTEVKKRLTAAARADIAVVDGSPGIGCPVIASLSGADFVLIFAEPSVSGISDLRRIVKTAETFQGKIAVCTNKYNTNLEKARNIETYCTENGIPFMGRIPFDKSAAAAVNTGRTIVEMDCKSGRAVRAVFENTMHLIKTESKGECT
jgi:MinD superfamily P-loop ATPase